uniref:Essential for reactive oxygen species protein n=1 Tax=Homo sapiens TaxID=9606 RepID=A0A8V8TMR4_HUMAN
MYLQVETRTSSRLHLKRAPGIRSWSLLVGILSIGLAAAYYSGDSLGWKLFYVTGCLFVAVQNLEDWEGGASACCTCPPLHFPTGVGLAADIRL